MIPVLQAGGKGVVWITVASLASLALATAVHAQRLPTGGHIVGGSGAIGTPQGGSMAIDQSSSRLAIDWQQFNIGAGNIVRFNQPAADSVALNRVLGPDPSQILGQLQANGQVFLVNPNGILFGQDARVDVGALVASTLDIGHADFMAGNYHFRSESPNGVAAAVLNQGTITAADGGAVALLGVQVQNQGVIQARMGTVALAAGSAVTLDFAGDGLLNVQIDASAKDALVENGSLIQADGGQVLMTAHASDALLKTVVNNTGVIEARTVESRAGKIVLLGDFSRGIVEVAGTLDASAPDGGDGGFIETSGAVVRIDDSVSISTYAPNGRTGTWLIDPLDFTIDSDDGGCIPPECNRINASLLGTLLQSTNVDISTVDEGNELGDIHVNAPISWNSGHSLTLDAHNDININKSVSVSGMGGISLVAGRDINIDATLTTHGDMTRIEMDAGRDVVVKGHVDVVGDGAGLILNAGRHIAVSSESGLVLEGDNATSYFTAGSNGNGGNITIDAPLSIQGDAVALDMIAEGEILIRDSVLASGDDFQIFMIANHINVGNDLRNARVHVAGNEATISLAACSTNGCGTVIVNDEVSIAGNDGVIDIGADGGIFTAGNIAIEGDNGLIGLAGGSIDIAEGSTIEINGDNAAISLVACGFTYCDDGMSGDAPVDPGGDPSLSAGNLVLRGDVAVDSGGGDASIMLMGANVFVDETATVSLAGDSAGLLVVACGYSSCLDADDALEEITQDLIGSTTADGGKLFLAGNISINSGDASGLFVGGDVELAGPISVNTEGVGALLFTASTLQLGGSIDVSGENGFVQAFADTIDVNNSLSIVASGDFSIVDLNVCGCGGNEGGIRVNADIVVQSDKGIIDLSSDQGILINARLDAEDISLEADGDIVSTPRGRIAAQRLLVDSFEGSIWLDQGVHHVDSLHASANRGITFSNQSDLSLSQAWISGDGNIAVRSAGSLALVKVEDRNGDPLPNTGTFRIDGKGDFDLVAGEFFVNTLGANVFDINQGNWRIWSRAPAGGSLGGLNYDFKQYDASYGTPVLGEGDGVLYAFAPVLGVTLKGDISKVYDGTDHASVTGENFELHGVQKGDRVVLSGGPGRYSDPNAGRSKTVTVEGVNWYAYEVGGGAKVYGYRLYTPAGDVGVIHPRAITVAADDQRKYMGQADPTFTWRLIDGQLVGTDQLSGLLNRDAGELPGSYTINQGSLTGGGNYALSFVQGELVVLDPTAEFSQLGVPYRAAMFSAHGTPQGPTAFDQEYDTASSAGTSVYRIENGGLRMPEGI